MSARKPKGYIRGPWDTEDPPRVSPHHWSRQEPDGLAQYSAVDPETGEIREWRAPGPPITNATGDPIAAVSRRVVDPREGHPHA